jgi:hypothetical protein
MDPDQDSSPEPDADPDPDSSPESEADTDRGISVIDLQHGNTKNYF